MPIDTIPTGPNTSDPLDDDRDQENPAEYGDDYTFDDYDFDNDPDWS